MRVPIVLMIRQPPAYVPSAIASAADTMTQVGGLSKSGSRCPETISASAMIPIVFWASFVPCVKATKLPDTICARRNTRFTLLGERLRITQMITIISARAAAKPMVGESTPGYHDLVPDAVPLDHVKPRCRDRRAGDATDQGMARARRQAEEPRDQIPGDRTDEPGEDDAQGDRVRIHDPRRDRGCHRERDERADEVEDRRQEDCGPRCQRTRRDARRDRVRRVVEAVGEVEEERDGDDRYEGELLHDLGPQLLTRMFAMTFAAVSHASSACSSPS